MLSEFLLYRAMFSLCQMNIIFDLVLNMHFWCWVWSREPFWITSQYVPYAKSSILLGKYLFLNKMRIMIAWKVAHELNTGTKFHSPSEYCHINKFWSCFGRKSTWIGYFRKPAAIFQIFSIFEFFASDFPSWTFVDDFQTVRKIKCFISYKYRNNNNNKNVFFLALIKFL